MATLEKINAFLKAVNAAAWGPPLLFLLLDTDSSYHYFVNGLHFVMCSPWFCRCL